MGSKEVTLLTRLLTTTAAATTVVEEANCRSFGRAGATGSAGSRALRSSAEAAEWPRASFFSSVWAWCSLWLLWARGDDGPALPCHGAAASACKGHHILQHMALACM